jgi:hypothetical protein
MEMHCIDESRVRAILKSAGAAVLDVRLTNSTDPSFNGDLHYLEAEPTFGYISKQYCVTR